jgi:hypothetical protein
LSARFAPARNHADLFNVGAVAEQVRGCSRRVPNGTDCGGAGAPSVKNKHRSHCARRTHEYMNRRSNQAHAHTVRLDTRKQEEGRRGDEGIEDIHPSEVPSERGTKLMRGALGAHAPMRHQRGIPYVPMLPSPPARQRTAMGGLHIACETRAGSCLLRAACACCMMFAARKPVKIK